MFAAALSFFLITLNASMVTTALPAIGRDLGAGPTLAWVLTGYSLVFAVCLHPAGAWADRIGARRAFTLGITVFATTSAICAIAGDLAVLLAARAIQGAAAAAVLPAGLALLSAAHPDPADRSKAVGRWAAAGAIALVLGSPLGGAITTLAGWPGTFWLNVPVALLTLVPRLPSTPPQPRRRLDGLLRTPPVLVSSATGFALNFASYGAIFVVTLMLQQDLGQSAWTTGLVFVPMTLLIIPANLLAGHLRRPLPLGLLLMIAGLTGLAITGTEATLWQVIAWLLPIGAGAGLVAPAVTTMMLDGMPPDRSGLGAGLLNASRQFGSGAAPAIFGALLSTSIGFRLSTGLAAVVVAASLSLTGVPRPTRHPRS
ncbi:MFS transporter [Kribbella sp. NPDC050124]|uniref:MFS transporter n=1 Tax=Kribbella sp. NPDC050124 TaxID=3364114 RepID=UPI003787BF37